VGRNLAVDWAQYGQQHFVKKSQRKSPQQLPVITFDMVNASATDVTADAELVFTPSAYSTSLASDGIFEKLLKSLCKPFVVYSN